MPAVTSAISTVVKRHVKDGVTPELVKEIMGLSADTPDSTKVNNDEFDKKYQAVKSAGGAAQPDPAIAEFQAWRDTRITEMNEDAFTAIRSHPARENDRVLWILFSPAVGARRWITEGAAKLREKHGTHPFYLLSEELENEGLVFISKLAGCPKPDATCSICKNPLFANERRWKDYLREDVLERVLMAQVEVGKVQWRNRHTGCHKFGQWKNNFSAARLSLESQLGHKGVTGEDRDIALKELNETWSTKGHKLVGWLWFNRFVTREECDRLRASIDQITNTSNTKTKKEK